MNPTKRNAFLRPAGEGDPPPCRSLAGLLAPMRARLVEQHFGHRLELDPIRALDALRPWGKISEETAHLTLVLRPGEVIRRRGEIASTSLADLASAREIPVVERYGPDALLIDRLALGELVSAVDGDGLVLILIEGPIDAGDIRAIENALAAERSPLEVELRAVASMRLVHDRAVVVDTRDPMQAAAFVGENFRHYLAAVQGNAAAEYAAPEDALVDRLLYRSGRLTVRPIETEVYSTSIDVGISCSDDAAVRPADTSLIYDLHSRTWHGE
jgi:hypothetical protein